MVRLNPANPHTPHAKPPEPPGPTTQPRLQAQDFEAAATSGWSVPGGGAALAAAGQGQGQAQAGQQQGQGQGQQAPDLSGRLFTTGVQGAAYTTCILLRNAETLVGGPHRARFFPLPSATPLPPVALQVLGSLL